MNIFEGVVKAICHIIDWCVHTSVPRDLKELLDGFCKISEGGAEGEAFAYDGCDLRCAVCDWS